MKYGRMKVMNMNRVSHNIVRKIICFTISDTRLYPSARHPHCKTARMMVSPIHFLGKFTLTINTPAKLATPND
jgi:hypothetical protein